MSDSMRPHRLQPTRLPRPWDSPGKNTGVGCHFLLQCLKSESEVAQSCLTLRDPMDCILPGSSIHGIFQARVLEWVYLLLGNAQNKKYGKSGGLSRGDICFEMLNLRLSASQVGVSSLYLSVQISLPANAGDLGDPGSIPRLGRSPEGSGNPLQYSCLKNPMDRGAWQA